MSDRPDGIIEIHPETSIFDANAQKASMNLERFLATGVTSINMMGTIGAGKTSLLEAIVKILSKKRILMIGGDIATTVDTDRVQQHGADVIQIHSGCHLDATLIDNTLNSLDLTSYDICLIENVGNLICPANFPLGTHKRVCVVSVTEGPYMIRKHPVIILNSNVLVINKVEFADAMEVDVEQLKRDALEINPNIKIVTTSARKGLGIDILIKELGLDA